MIEALLAWTTVKFNRDLGLQHVLEEDMLKVVHALKRE
jgi:hypothetical protein